MSQDRLSVYINHYIQSGYMDNSDSPSRVDQSGDMDCGDMDNNDSPSRVDQSGYMDNNDSPSRVDRPEYVMIILCWNGGECDRYVISKEYLLSRPALYKAMRDQDELPAVFMMHPETGQFTYRDGMDNAAECIINMELYKNTAETFLDATDPALINISSGLLKYNVTETYVFCE